MSFCKLLSNEALTMPSIPHQDYHNRKTYAADTGQSLEYKYIVRMKVIVIK